MPAVYGEKWTSRRRRLSTGRRPPRMGAGALIGPGCVCVCVVKRGGVLARGKGKLCAQAIPSIYTGRPKLGGWQLSMPNHSRKLAGINNKLNQFVCPFSVGPFVPWPTIVSSPPRRPAQGLIRCTSTQVCRSDINDLVHERNSCRVRSLYMRSDAMRRISISIQHYFTTSFAALDALGVRCSIRPSVVASIASPSKYHSILAAQTEKGVFNFTPCLPILPDWRSGPARPACATASQCC